jgi:chromosome segregation ATPase
MEEEGLNFSGLEGLDEELELFLSDVRSRERDHSARIVELEAEVRRRDEEARAAAAGLAASESSRLSAEKEYYSRLGSLREALAERDAASSRLALKAEELSARAASLEKELERERAASREKDVYIQSAKSAVRSRDAEFEKVCRLLEEARAETDAWKARTAELDSRLADAAGENKALALEIRKLENSLRQAAVGFRQKLDLVKRERPPARDPRRDGSRGAGSSGSAPADDGPGPPDRDA